MTASDRVARVMKVNRPQGPDATISERMMWRRIMAGLVDAMFDKGTPRREILRFARLAGGRLR